MTEREALLRLVRRKVSYLPLEIVSVKEQEKKGRGFDAKVSIGWRRCRIDFIAGVETRTAPKFINKGLRRLKSCPGNRKRNLLLIVPFLSKIIIKMLEREDMSGLDLNGNYLIQSPEMAAIRLDKENQYQESQPIKKIFSGNSSLLGRLFLSAKRRFESVNEAYSTIRNLGGSSSRKKEYEFYGF